MPDDIPSVNADGLMVESPRQCSSCLEGMTRLAGDGEKGVWECKPCGLIEIIGAIKL